MSEVKRYETSWDAQAIYDLGSVVAASDFDDTLARIAVLREDLASANADKAAYAQNAIDLRKRVTWLQGAHDKPPDDLVAGHCTRPNGCTSCSWCGFKAKQSPGETVAARVTAYTPGMGLVELRMPGGIPPWLELGEIVTVAREKKQRQAELVTMALPERQIIPSTLLAGLTRKWAEGWNEALDEVARLNKPK